MKKGLDILALLVVDLLTLAICLDLSILIRKNFLPSIIGFPEFLGKGLSTYWWVLPIWISFFAYEGLLTKRFSFWDEVKQLWKAIFFSTVAVFSLLFLGKMGEKYSRTLIVLIGITSFFVFPAIRINAKKLLRRIGILRSKVLIIGAGKRGRLISRALKEEHNLGYKVVGFLDDDPEKAGTLIEGVKVHKGVDKAERYIGRSGINTIVIAIPGASKERLNEIINKLQHKAENILFIPDILGIAVLGTKLQHFFREQAFALELQNNLAKPFNIFIKRSFDFIVGSFLLLLLSVPIACMCLLIRLDSPGPAIFSQERIGRKGRPFKCYKFRTMFKDAEEKVEELLHTNENIRREWEQARKIKEDPRITKIGKFLRTTSLDELPQLMNILKGEMSLVGPRPAIQEEIEKYYRDNTAELYFSVPPGITGLWQVSGRSTTGYAYRIALDSWYVRNWNLWLDVVILLKTVKVVLKREGAW
jgi:Undecaprenyl-phosphate galactose phosphotransferase WbaP